MDDEPEKSYPLKPSNMSKAPSWVTLGFLFGVLFVWMLPKEEKKFPASEKTSSPPAPVRSTRPMITMIEAVFADWGKYAVWEDDLTEVALWNSETRKFEDCYEVKRMGDILYFRSIPQLTRRVVRHGKPLPNSPLQFTETEQQYQEWLEHGRTEQPPATTSTATSP